MKLHCGGITSFILQTYNANTGVFSQASGDETESKWTVLHYALDVDLNVLLSGVEYSLAASRNPGE